MIPPKLLWLLEAILGGIHDMSEEGLTINSVMKDNMGHLKKSSTPSLYCPFPFRKNWSCLMLLIAK